MRTKVNDFNDIDNILCEAPVFLRVYIVDKKYNDRTVTIDRHGDVRFVNTNL